MNCYRIGDLARLTGTKVETIRWYEKQGLLQPTSRTASNYRSYGDAALARLSFIRRARSLGFSLDQVRELLQLARLRDADCGSVDMLTAAHLTQVDRKIADLRRLREELSGLLMACEGGSISECRIIDSLHIAPA